MSSPHRSKETSARWNHTDRDTFKLKADAGLIDINNTTPAYIETIRVKYWGSKRPDTFKNNFRTRAAELRLEREAAGQRAGKSLCLHAPATAFHKLTFDAIRPAADATTTKNKDDDADAAADDEDADDDNDEADADANADEEKLPPIMPPKKKPAAASETKAVDAVTDALKKVSVKAPAFVPYSTKVTDAYIIRTFIEGSERFVEVDLNLAAALCPKDGIKAILSNDGMSIRFQRGVFSSFFTNRRLRKDLSHAYNANSSMVAAHRNVYDKFKVDEANNTQSGIVYGDFQVVQLPEKCTGLVEQRFAGYAPSPFSVRFTTAEIEEGMTLQDERNHIQFVLNMTFRVKADFQLAKEKKAVRATVQSYDILEEIDSEDDSM